MTLTILTTIFSKYPFIFVLSTTSLSRFCDRVPFYHMLLLHIVRSRLEPSLSLFDLIMINSLLVFFLPFSVSPFCNWVTARGYAPWKTRSISLLISCLG
ncbi:hypothetical protein DFJ73DRAFT_815198 [Zopfochytrium polystomum]|nr:hypothetical protein DFJ73DRAFT_815198 [Zopfochytrium polystomum]